MSDVLVSFDGVFKGYPLKPQNAGSAAAVFARRIDNEKNLHFAVRGMSFSVRRGEKVALIGRNGAGKSTTLRLVNGAVKPTAGRVEVNGRVSALIDLGLGFHEELSGLENIRGALAYNGLSIKDQKDMTADIIEFCELGQFLDYPVKIYSAGMRMRLYFAVATAIKPDILIIDEVLGAGDAYFGLRSLERIQRLTDAGGALLLVSHNLGLAAEICSRGLWIEGGELVADGPTLAVFNMYTTYAADLQERAASAAGDAARSAPEAADSWIRRWLARRHAVPPSTTTTLNPLKLPGRLEADVVGRDGASVRRLSRHDYVACRINLACRAQTPTPDAAVEIILYVFAADGRVVAEAPCPAKAPAGADGATVLAEISDLPLGPGEYLVTGVAKEAGGTVWGVFEKSLRITVINPDPTETSLVLQDGRWSLRQEN